MNRPTPAGQRGATLVTVLVLLLIMTLLGVVGLRTTLLEERMTGNLYDRSLAFQAAEAALREGETRAATRPIPPAAGGCLDAICNRPDPNTAPRWLDNSFWAGSAQNAATGLTWTGGPTIATPQYFIEMLADDVPARGSCTTSGDVSESVCTGSERRYRITARARDTDANARAAVIVQSIFAVP